MPRSTRRYTPLEKMTMEAVRLVVGMYNDENPHPRPAMRDMLTDILNLAGVDRADIDFERVLTRLERD